MHFFSPLMIPFQCQLTNAGIYVGAAIIIIIITALKGIAIYWCHKKSEGRPTSVGELITCWWRLSHFVNVLIFACLEAAAAVPAATVPAVQPVQPVQPASAVPAIQIQPAAAVPAVQPQPQMIPLLQTPIYPSLPAIPPPYNPSAPQWNRLVSV